MSLKAGDIIKVIEVDEDRILVEAFQDGMRGHGVMHQITATGDDQWGPSLVVEELKVK